MTRRTIDASHQMTMFGPPPEWAKDLAQLRARNRRNARARLRRIGADLRELPPERPNLDLDTAQDSAHVDAWLTSHRREAPLRDYQRMRAYRWEQRQPWWDRDPIDLAAAADLIEILTEITDVEVVPGRKSSGTAWAKRHTRAICLPPSMRFASVVCHEAAHLLGWFGDGHGPIWVRRYCILLDRAGIVSERIAAASALAAGLDVAPAIAAHECARSVDQTEAGARNSTTLTLTADRGGRRHGKG